MTGTSPLQPRRRLHHFQGLDQFTPDQAQYAIDNLSQ
ncbi:Ltp family lipoprotein [Micrococcus luteus]